MIGAIIGDIVGSKYEFNNTFDYDFELFPRGCSFTDDSICTVAVADALMTGEDFQTAMLRWCRAYPHPTGSYGGRFSWWILSDDPQPYGSFGNGSAMRVSAVGWWCDSEEEVIRQAERSAAITHNHPEGIKGAVAVAHAIFRLRRGEGKEALQALAEQYYPGFMNKTYPRGLFDETCQGTVPLCFRLVLQSKDFEDALRLAISYGGDSDTIGAIVGSMAEPLFGIPEEIRQKALAVLDERMRKLVDKFSEKLGLLPL